MRAARAPKRWCDVLNTFLGPVSSPTTGRDLGGAGATSGCIAGALMRSLLGCASRFPSSSQTVNSALPWKERRHGLGTPQAIATRCNNHETTRGQINSAALATWPAVIECESNRGQDCRCSPRGRLAAHSSAHRATEKSLTLAHARFFT
jgi:hypothetical protein